MVNPMRMKFSSLKIVWLLLLILLITCTPQPTKKIELTFWAMGAEGEYIQQLLPRFKAEHPDMNVKIQAIPWTAAHEKLLTAYAGQSTPDVCQLGNTWIPEFQAIEALLPLDSLLAQSTTIHDTAYFNGIWQTNVIGKSVYGIPWYVDTRLLFYRTDILKSVGYVQPPSTWEEWRDVSLKIHHLSEAERQKYAVFFSMIYNDWQVPAILILQNNGRLLKENDCYGAFDEPATIEALRYYLSFFQDGLAVRSMTEVSNLYQGFSDGVFSMMITGPWNINEMRKRFTEMTGRWSTAPMPMKQNGSSIAGGASLVIFKNTKNVAAAWKLVEFLSRSDIQIEFFRLTRDLPAVRTAWQSEELLNDREIRAFYTQLESVLPTPKIAEWEQVAVKIQEHLEKAIFGKVELTEMVAHLNTEVNQILEKRRWMLERGLIQAAE